MQSGINKMALSTLWFHWGFGLLVFLLSTSWVYMKKRENSVSKQYPVLKKNYHVKVDMVRERFILISRLYGKFCRTYGVGPVNVNMVEVLTPVWNVSWTGRVNPCFVWGCTRGFSRTIMPSWLCLNHPLLNIMCAECDSYRATELRSEKKAQMYFYTPDKHFFSLFY